MLQIITQAQQKVNPNLRIEGVVILVAYYNETFKMS